MSGIYLYCRLWRQHCHSLQLLQRDRKVIQNLTELKEQKSRYVANIAHECRTMLTLILSQTERILEKQGKARNAPGMKMVRENINWRLKLINQILELCHLESSPASLHPCHLDLVDLLHILMSSFEYVAKQKGIRLCLEAGSPSLVVRLDPILLENMFDNLLSNALKSIPPEGQVKVWAGRQADGCVCIQITVTGIDVPEANLPHIFDRFYWAGNMLRSGCPGWDIGLVLAREQVNLQGGSLRVSRNVGKGSVVTVAFPATVLVGRSTFPIPPGRSSCQHRSRASARSAHASQNREPTFSGKPNWVEGVGASPTVLVVENKSGSRRILVDQLNSRYRLLIAENGAQGLDLARRAMPDLVLTDLKMPGLDGHGLCLALKFDERTSHIPIIVLSARADRENRIRAFCCGADEVMTKPINGQELRIRMDNLIALRERLRQAFLKPSPAKDAPIGPRWRHQNLLDRVLTAVHAGVKKEQFNVPALAGELAMSVSQLNRKLRALTGQSAGHLIRTVRLQRAADLLKQETLTVAEICYQVGFPDQANFTRAFKKQFGQTPGSFRKTEPPE